MATQPQDEFPATEPDSPAVAPSAVGAALRAARERTGKDVAEVARRLRIRQPFLQALEEGRHKDLPGGTYAIGFLRTYAKFLDLDSEEMVRRFKQEAAEDLHSRSELVFPSPVSEGRVPNGSLLFIGLVVAAVAYGGWFWLNSRQAKVGDGGTALPERLFSEFNRPASLTIDKAQPAQAEPAKPAEPDASAKPAESDASAKPAESAETPDKAKDDVAPPADEEGAAQPEAAKPEAVKERPAKPEAAKPEAAKERPSKAAKPEAAKPEAAKPEAAKPETAKPEAAKPETAKPEAAKPETAKPETAKPETAKPEAAKPEAAEPEAAAAEPAQPAAAPAPAAAATTAARIVIKAAADDCWMQVREMDGRLLVSRLLRRGDTFDVPDRPGLSLTVGNAGALAVTVDGKAIPSLGAIGQVRRDITLDPAKLQQGG